MNALYPKRDGSLQTGQVMTRAIGTAADSDGSGHALGAWFRSMMGRPDPAPEPAPYVPAEPVEILESPTETLVRFRLSDIMTADGTLPKVVVAWQDDQVLEVRVMRPPASSEEA